MSQKLLFDKVCLKASQLTTRAYSTSFSFGIMCLERKLRNPIYSIYGFVRFADEIVDSFQGYDKAKLLERFKEDTWKAIEDKISLNPILNSFQRVVHEFAIDPELIEKFLYSMEMDLVEKKYNQKQFEQYVLGSAEVVGLMCLRVFTNGDYHEYEKLKPAAMKLGSAFQKINFLRDLNCDFSSLGRNYFPGVEIDKFDEDSKKRIEQSIAADFHDGYLGIKQLPRGSRLGVYVAYLYYRTLFRKIKNLPSEKVLESRIRVTNRYKIAILGYSFLKHQFNLI